MTARYEELKGLKNIGQKYAYSDREVMLYAYGIGLGADPMDEKELASIEGFDENTAAARIELSAEAVAALEAAT